MGTRKGVGVERKKNRPSAWTKERDVGTCQERWRGKHAQRMKKEKRDWERVMAWVAKEKSEHAQRMYMTRETGMGSCQIVGVEQKEAQRVNGNRGVGTCQGVSIETS